MYATYSQNGQKIIVCVYVCLGIGGKNVTKMQKTDESG